MYNINNHNFEDFCIINKNIVNNHDEIKEKLLKLKLSNNIPNIIFHGQNNSGKKTIVNYFIDLIYNNDQHNIKNNVLTINCSFNKGIKFIREDLKFFCKTIVNYDNGKFFKSIILINGDKLTIDAQSALRRCIEIYSHNTRFFLIVENKNKLLKPIISRFASILLINYNLSNIKSNRNDKINILLQKNKDKTSLIEVNNLTNLLYNNGYSANDLFNYYKLKKPDKLLDNNIETYNILLDFLNIKNEIRNEKLLIFYLLKHLFIRCNNDL
tara:strand:+ start:892 stop:1698 length:807 start_codon:yes stop_codon:yes gene_type:complete